MYIHNVKGSSKISAKPPRLYNSWLSYWEAQAQFRLDINKHYICPACSVATLRKDFDGCHVQKSGCDKSWYIVPLCSSCNHKNGFFNVEERLLVPVPSNL